MNRRILLFIIASFYGYLLSSQDIAFQQHIVADNFIDGYDVWPYDLNNDGCIDILACGNSNGGQVAYWLNDGTGNFTQTILKEGLSGARSVRAEDMNGDLLPDIVCGAWMANDVVYFEAEGDGSYTEHIVDNDFKGAHTIDLKDVNGDGLLDILCSGFDYYGHNGEIAWWENNGEDSISWAKHLISDRFQQSPFIYGEDMDNDGDVDVIACGELNDEILWWENDGTGEFIGEHMVDSLFYSAHTVIARDIDQDSDMDILAAGCMQTKLAWYENDGSQNFIKHNLTPNGGDLWLDAADLDLDGDMDLVCAAMSCSNIRWYENDGNQQFSRYNVDGTFTSGFSVIPVNMDADGDIDLLAIGRTSDKISWFENNADSTTHTGDVFDIPEIKVRVYPNPCYDHLNLYVDHEGLKHISITSSNGKRIRVFQTPDKRIPIWCGNFPDGMYFLKVKLLYGKESALKFIKK
ncbi:MAG: T9SS type A sorting domain-containing protein [Bacteroidales bacterium]|jgi:hypothetical protein|nr:T9SS type A sorting domain-containing protein [Bacteroidales bacterium]